MGPRAAAASGSSAAPPLRPGQTTGHPVPVSSTAQLSAPKPGKYIQVTYWLQPQPSNQDAGLCGKHGTMPTCTLGCSTTSGCPPARTQPCPAFELLRCRRCRRHRSGLLEVHRPLLPLQVLQWRTMRYNNRHIRG